MIDREEFLEWMTPIDFREHTTIDLMYMAWQAARQQAVPSDCRMVPVEPTEAMLDAGYNAYGQGHFTPAILDCYRAMVASAPQAEQAVEPFGYIRKAAAEHFARDEIGVRANIMKMNLNDDCVALYTAPPTPDVSGLVDALERISGLCDGGYDLCFIKRAVDAVLKTLHQRFAHKQEGK